jgi:hypothetical protein
MGGFPDNAREIPEIYIIMGKYIIKKGLAVCQPLDAINYVNYSPGITGKEARASLTLDAG